MKGKNKKEQEHAATGRPAPETPAVASSRLSRALGRIRDEAARALQHEPAPRRLPGVAVADAPPAPPLEAGLSEEERRGLAEIEDEQGRLLLCMKPDDALRQGLALRLAALAPRTGCGRRVLLSKSREGGPKKAALWDLYVTAIRPGEAGEEAALRLLEEKAGIGGLPLRLAAEAGVSDNLRGSVRLYTADLPVGILPDPVGDEILEADADELAALAERSPELLTPELLWAAGTGALFRRG